MIHPELLRCIAEMQACTEPCMGAAIGWKDWAIESMIICDLPQNQQLEHADSSGDAR